MKKLFGLLAACALLLTSGTTAQAVTIDWATVGDAGNAGDVQPDDTFGSVGYIYNISKHEVTNAQYVEFLNAAAATDPFALYNTDMEINWRGGIIRDGTGFGSWVYSVKADAIGKGPGGSDYSYANKPVNYVSWYDTLRYSNWLTSGTTESGTYTITGGGANSGTVSLPDHSTLVPGQYFLPTEDEWYKAAYFDGNTYYDYATGSDTTPDNNLPSADTGNSVNYYPSGGSSTTGDSRYPLTDVGDYELSASPYGTFDQGGNVFEWNEAVLPEIDERSRGKRGGSFNLPASWMAASHQSSLFGTTEHYWIGFRVASAVEATPASCGTGDSDCDGDVDLDDIIEAIGNFTGPCTHGINCLGDPNNGPPFGKTPEQGDTSMPPDGDVDLDDIINIVGGFTGPLDEEGLIAASDGDPGLPDLKYDPITGEVFLDATDIGGTLQAYNIKNPAGLILNGNFNAILGGPPATSLTTEIGEFQLSPTATLPGGTNIGAVFPAGLSYEEFYALDIDGSASPSFGGGTFAWELIYLGEGPGFDPPTVPEPSAYVIAVMGLFGFGFIGWRRKRV